VRDLEIHYNAIIS
jgi:type II secretory pathway predicted ATPase ExeA